jgi:hypothetical protein
MAITTLAGLVAAQNQKIGYTPSVTRTVVGSSWCSLFNCGASADIPTDGVLAGTSTTTGVVPTDATAGFPPIRNFNGGTGLISNVTYSSRSDCQLCLVDVLWKGGAYAFNANTTGQTPTSYASRVPNSDYSACEIWLEQVTVGTGVQNVAITYINEAGTAGRTTGTVATATNIVGRMWQIGLQAGDKGVQGITGVVGSVATVGTFNILVVRRLWSGGISGDGEHKVDGLFAGGMPQIYEDSAVMGMISSATTSMGWPMMEFSVVSG